MLHLTFLGRPTTEASEVNEVIIQMAANEVKMFCHIDIEQRTKQDAKIEQIALSFVHIKDMK